MDKERIKLTQDQLLMLRLLEVEQSRLLAALEEARLIQQNLVNSILASAGKFGKFSVAVEGDELVLTPVSSEL